MTGGGTALVQRVAMGTPWLTVLVRAWVDGGELKIRMHASLGEVVDAVTVVESTPDAASRRLAAWLEAFVAGTAIESRTGTVAGRRRDDDATTAENTTPK